MEDEADGCDVEKVKNEPGEEFHKRIDHKQCELSLATKAWSVKINIIKFLNNIILFILKYARLIFCVCVTIKILCAKN